MTLRHVYRKTERTPEETARLRADRGATDLPGREPAHAPRPLSRVLGRREHR